MIKTLTLAALVATSFAGSALASQHHRRVPANAADYQATYEQRAAAPAPAAAAPAAREDFGSYGAGATAHALGY